jgi:hypothetical protein
LDASYLSSFGQLELHLLEGKWRAFRFKYGDFVVFGQLRSHFDPIEDNGGYFLKMSCRGSFYMADVTDCESSMMSVRHCARWIEVWRGLTVTPRPAYVGSNKAVDIAASLFPRMQEIK